VKAWEAGVSRNELIASENQALKDSSFGNIAPHYHSVIIRILNLRKLAQFAAQPHDPFGGVPAIARRAKGKNQGFQPKPGKNHSSTASARSTISAPWIMPW
jgi:hypothetical protein